MHKKLKNMEGVELFENEVVGPELIGTIEYVQGDRYEFYGAIIPTTHRLFIKIQVDGDEIHTRDVLYKDITGISHEKLLMVGTMLHIWIGEKIEISMKSVSDGRIDRFLEFLYKYRSRELNLEPEQESNVG
ncbi:hypothetical protein [Salinicoccus sp. HZC-1]|uniref:hypothetical protein n=1 Tax=Salinicoccus sp. HZC-1 TaxID=3385497 RepID=UPI00398BA126